LVQVAFDAIELGHVVTASLVAERQLLGRGQLRHSVSFVQIEGLHGLHIGPSVERPRLDGPGRRLDLQVGSTKRALGKAARRQLEQITRPDEHGASSYGISRHIAFTRMGMGLLSHTITALTKTGHAGRGSRECPGTIGYVGVSELRS
jgi:hypothetical protein